MKTKFKLINTVVIATIVSIGLLSCKKGGTDEPKVVEIKNIDGSYRLFRHGEPYYIVGGGGISHFEELKDIGGNSIRTWSLHNAEEILDKAEENGLTVTLGIEIGKQHWGNDFNYWNPKAVNEKVEEIREVIIKYKDHPALLMWGVGNEVHFFGGNRLMICLFINKVAKMIHEVDPNHPVMTTTTVSPNLKYYGLIRILCPHLDLIGINAFEKLPKLHKDIKHPLGWNKPYVISEFGTQGPWETIDTEWGAPIERSSTENAEYIKDYWKIVSMDKKYSLGGYAFYWGYKYEVTNTWFSLFSKEGYKSEIVNRLQESWTGKKPKNEAPLINMINIIDIPREKNIYLGADNIYTAKVNAQDPENDNMKYSWEIRTEGPSYHSVGRHNYIYSHLITDPSKNTVQFTTPKEEGAYRLFIFVYDDAGNFATANIPFYVIHNKI
ncbi:glycoside hydrolase family 2 TIM barrel-domain containing protein [Belliella marina]|uniref:Glycoside hydrolase family 2 TIM barrel-domain containing protein n=1 Tax=Belliella marina TaxID=1644146 RepID=A0ABW4VNU4_9BACT